MAPKKPIKTIPRPQPAPEIKNKKPDKKSNDPGAGHKFIAFMTDERTRIILGIGVLLGVLFLLVSFISYFFFAYADQSKMDLNWHELQQIRSDSIIRHGYGIASFAILYFGMVVGLRLLKIRIASVWKAFFHAGFWLIWLSVTLGYALIPFYNNYTFSFSPGGEQGDETSKWLISYVGMSGTLMILIGSLLIYSIISSKSTIPFLKGLF